MSYRIVFQHWGNSFAGKLKRKKDLRCAEFLVSHFRKENSYSFFYSDIKFLQRQKLVQNKLRKIKNINIVTMIDYKRIFE